MPVTSALNICMPPDELSIGTTARVNRMIPIPPIHCISARHIWMEWLRLSMSSITDTPVVENPDIDSKNASLTDSCALLIMKGSMPKSEKTTHTKAVSRNPSRLPMLVRDGRTPNVINAPAPAVMPALMANGTRSPSP